MTLDLRHETLTRSVIGAFYDVYNQLGFGFLENIYTTALEHELKSRNHSDAREFGAQVWYKGIPLGTYKLDLVVDETVVLEVKSTRLLPEIAERQLQSYLHATSFGIGLLLHFGPKPRFRRLLAEATRGARRRIAAP